MATAGSNFAANDAAADARDGQAPDRPPTEAERAYLKARAEETAANVKTIERQIKGWERSLAEARKLHEDAVKALDAGRDLPAVQKRRAR